MHQDGESGDVTALQLENEETVPGDFFVDCSGFRSLLLGQTLGVPFVDWTHWLPCDGAYAAPTAKIEDAPSYTLAKAHQAGWRWRIPLQNRTGNGFVFSSAHLDKDKALDLFLTELGEAPLADPRYIPFTTGMREKTWEKNVYAIGLSFGFLEPLESTSIYAIQSSIVRLFKNFPRMNAGAAKRDYVNREAQNEFEHLRDFILLHYIANGRTGEPFWDQCRSCDAPASLKASIDLWRSVGNVPLGEKEFFRLQSWAAIFAGLDVIPESYHPAADAVSNEALSAKFNEMREYIKRAVAAAPRHADFIARLNAKQ